METTGSLHSGFPIGRAGQLIVVIVTLLLDVLAGKLSWRS